MSSMIAVLAVVARHPSLWATGIGQARRTVPARWWRRRPFLPVPDAEYLGFRMITQYGDISHRPVPEDVLNYLRWCRDWRRLDP